MECSRAKSYSDRLTLSINGLKIKQVDKVRFLGVIIDEKLTWDVQIKHLEDKLLTTIVLIKRIRKFLPSSQYMNVYQSLFVSHLTYGISCWGGVYHSKLQKLFNIQKRCIRILFGQSLSFDHAAFYQSCSRARTYQDHIKPKDFELEHTKPLFTKHNLLTLYNLYTTRTILELFKIIKIQSPISMYKIFTFCPITHNYKLLPPKFKLDISKNNFTVSSIVSWNSCIGKLLDQPILCIPKFTGANGLKLIIPGNVKNSDLTISKGVFKKRLTEHFIKLQTQGNADEW